MKYDVAIIGAGPAGIMAAITAKQNGASVILIEKNEAIGRKILATGNGRCNITNKFAKVENYHGSSPEFIKNVLSAFDQHKTMKFFDDLGLILKEEDRGRMFPRTNQAASVVDILAHELERLKVDIKLNAEVKKIEKNDGWEIVLADGSKINSGKLILTTGGRAAHQFGSSGDGHFWMKNIGHKVEDIYAALVPLETKETWVTDVQGLKVEAQASFFVDEKLVSQKSGDLIFTHFGLSGPAIMSQAGIIAPFVGNKTVQVKLDFIGEKSAKELDEMIAKIFNSSGAKSTKNALVGLVPAKLIPIILHESKISDNKIAAEISKIQREEIVKNLKSLTLNISKLRPLKEAQVTRGGISTDEINSETLESKKIKGLYFAGEIMDVDGDSGGFNLQWAWSSGHLAGKSCTKWD
ncbi:MAG: NAD(P)/FAD-dependent oxidoreductase [Candidatus Berkelbacteria bacterium]|nr:NAD(P)/FAD-dependent oxidoreductase [Candidatus Berkelbacteria bacterium]